MNTLLSKLIKGIKNKKVLMKSQGWSELNNKLEKTFKFNNYNEVVLFSNKVMQIAIKQDHHPEINIHYNSVKVRITDFERGTVSDKCRLLVSEVDKIAIE